MTTPTAISPGATEWSAVMTRASRSRVPELGSVCVMLDIVRNSDSRALQDCSESHRNGICAIGQNVQSQIRTAGLTLCAYLARRVVPSFGARQFFASGMPHHTSIRAYLRGIAAIALAALLSGCNMVVLNPSGDIAAQQGRLVVISTLLMLLIIVP